MEAYIASSIFVIDKFESAFVWMYVCVWVCVYSIEQVFIHSIYKGKSIKMTISQPISAKSQNEDHKNTQNVTRAF